MAGFVLDKNEVFMLVYKAITEVKPSCGQYGLDASRGGVLGRIVLPSSTLPGITCEI